MIISSYGTMDAFIVYARPEFKSREFSSTLLNGEWFTQTIGSPSKILKVQIALKWSELKKLLELSRTKEIFSIKFLNKTYDGFIIEHPIYDIGQADDVDPIYIADFEMAVIE